jgi:hypothetical protein
MNLQLQPRSNLMLARAHSACVFIDSRSFPLLLSARSDNMLKFVRYYQRRGTAPSTHNSPPHPDRQNHPNCIQLP